MISYYPVVCIPMSFSCVQYELCHLYSEVRLVFSSSCYVYSKVVFLCSASALPDVLRDLCPVFSQRHTTYILKSLSCV